MHNGPSSTKHIDAMTLTELRYLVALARERHFGHAAQACNVSQPTLSAAIKKLEEQLGMPLFERRPREVVVTPQAEPIVTQAQRVLEQADLLSQMARSPLLEHADLRVAPASPGKAQRLTPFLQAERGTLYVNLEEAGLLCQATFDNSRDAATALLSRGAVRAVVTDGGNPATVGAPSGLITQNPPPVSVTRVTGAGDTFMAAHIAAEIKGAAPDAALTQALSAAAQYVSGETKI